MSHLRLTHPDRPTLQFRQLQSDESQRQAVANVTPELGVDRPPLVHIETQERARAIQGRVTAPRRARDSGESDWLQALANYADELESHVDEYQGEGYTLEDDIRGESLNSIFESVSWTLSAGNPYEFTFDGQVRIGQGTYQSQDTQPRNPTVNTDMDVAATVGGVDLPGLREMEVSRSIGVEVRGVFDRDNAENNDIIADEGVQQLITFRGTLTGTQAERQSAEDDLKALQDGDQRTFVTRFPGYELDGFVTDYTSTIESRMGGRITHFDLEFIEGERA